MNRQQISKEACAKYAKIRGNEPQQLYRFGLNRFIMAGYSVADAEAQALAVLHKTHPGFVPVRASTQAFITAFTQRT